jgi:hypothetical protein
MGIRGWSSLELCLHNRRQTHYVLRRVYGVQVQVPQPEYVRAGNRFHRTPKAKRCSFSFVCSTASPATGPDEWNRLQFPEAALSSTLSLLLHQLILCVTGRTRSRSRNEHSFIKVYAHLKYQNSRFLETSRTCSRRFIESSGTELLHDGQLDRTRVPFHIPRRSSRRSLHLLLSISKA